MKELYKLKENLVSELGEFGNQTLSKTNLETIDKLAHAAKNVAKVIECCDKEEYSSDGYSRRRDPSMDYVRPDGSYRDGVSGARGRYSGDSVNENTKRELMRLIEKM